MTKVPSLSYEKVIGALKRDGWVVVRQRGSHIRLQKHTHSRRRVEAHHTSSPADQAIYALSHPEAGASVGGGLSGAAVTLARVSSTVMA